MTDETVHSEEAFDDLGGDAPQGPWSVQDERLALALRAGEIGLWAWDLQADQAFWSESLYALLRRARDRPITASTFFEYIHPDDRARVDAWAKQWIAQGGEKRDEFRVIRDDGEERWFAMQGRIVQDERKDVREAVGVNFDITDRKTSEASFRQVQESLEQRVAERTAELQKSIRRLEKEIHHRSLAEQHIRDQADKLQRSNQELHERTEQLREESQRRYQAQTEVQTERDRLFSVLNQLPGYVVLKDRDYAIRFASHGFLDSFGEPAGKTCHQVQYDRSEPCPDCPLREVVEEGRSYNWEEPLSDGRTYRIWAFPFRETDGTNLLLEFGIDITDRKELELRITETSESERRRIGRDLHDTLGQTMTGLGYLVEGLAERIAQHLPEENEQARLIVDELFNATAQVRALSHGLDPIGLEQEGLFAALRELAASVESTTDMRCAVRCDKPPPFDEVRSTQLYRICQEALTNATRHARADRIDIEIARGDGCWLVSITDDGVGLPSDFLDGDGMGLRIMKYRAGAINASLRIQPVPTGGTRIVCQLPDIPQPPGEKGSS